MTGERQHNHPVEGYEVRENPIEVFFFARLICPEHPKEP
jgi:hypothetical protein